MKVAMWGGRSQGRLVSQMVAELGGEIVSIYDHSLDKMDWETNAQFFNEFESFAKTFKNTTHFIVSIGAEHGYPRVLISDFLESNTHLKPASVIHKSAIIAPTAKLGKGLQIMPGSIIHHFTEIGDYSIINTKAHVDHECQIGRGCHLMGGASLAGRITLMDFVSVGTNATVIPDRHIGKGAYIGAGAVAIKDVQAFEVVAGNPARFLKKREFVLDKTTELIVQRQPSL